MPKVVCERGPDRWQTMLIEWSWRRDGSTPDKGNLRGMALSNEGSKVAAYSQETRIFTFMEARTQGERIAICASRALALV